MFLKNPPRVSDFRFMAKIPPGLPGCHFDQIYIIVLFVCHLKIENHISFHTQQQPRPLNVALNVARMTYSM